MAFQFPPLREGRREERGSGYRQDISIPAPPRGATNAGMLCLEVLTFQFTPLREGRRIAAGFAVRHFYFNSRPSARGDTWYRWKSSSVRPLISIHAPPRGATHCERQGRFRSLYFNSRPSARGDGAGQLDAIPTIFQFTPLREGRHSTPSCPLSVRHFNSRPSARGDMVVISLCLN